MDAEFIKRNLSITQVFKHYGAHLIKAGGEHKTLCLFHKEKTPSLFINEEKGIYHCLGCNAKGDVIELVQQKERLEFKETLKFLKENFNINDSFGGIASKKTELFEGAAPPLKIKGGQETQKDITLNKVAEYYHKQLLSNEKALEYLKSRGLKNPQIWSRFGIGFADGTLLEKLGKSHKESLKETGILRERGAEHFKNCLTFPIYDDFGIVVGLYGRHISKQSNIKHIYLSGKHKGVFNRKASKVYPDELILTESVIDALSLIELGFENVQCTYGTNGFTKEHLKVLKEDEVKRVVIAFDNDEAGKKASKQLKEILLKEGFEIKVVYPLVGKDWNDSLLKGKTKGAISQFIKNAEITGEQKEEIHVKKENDHWYFTIDDLLYRLSGVKEVFITHLKVVVKAVFNDDFFVDTVDLCAFRSRSSFASHLSGKFGVEASRIERDLLHILEYLEKEREKNLSPEKEKERELTESEIDLGMKLLKSSNLFKQIVEDMNLLGYVGEDLNKQLMYLCASSRKMDDPISVLLTAQSASGKSYLVDIVKKLIPYDEVISATSLSDQALNYIEDLVHKFLVFGESMHNDTVDHQIREMLSDKELSRLVVAKDEKTGKLTGKPMKKKVVVASVMSTTSHKINPENASRYFLMNTDETVEQTRRIHESQRKKYSFERQHLKKNVIPNIIQKHHIAQKLLKKRIIINPFGKYLDFPTNLMRLRRDHDRFIDLIATVCFLRQYQKKVKENNGIFYIECCLKDYEIAYEIMVKGVLSSTLSDIPKGAIMLYEETRNWVKKKARSEGLKVEQTTFNQRELRGYTGLGADTVRKYIKVLVMYEYLELVMSVRRGKRFSYRLISDEPFEKLDISVIPTVAEIEQKMKKKK